MRKWKRKKVKKNVEQKENKCVDETHTKEKKEGKKTDRHPAYF